MDIYQHEHMNRIVIELEENEFTLIAFLIEKSKQKHQAVMKESLAEIMDKDIQEYINEH